ncbi:hypothetical protein H6P81_002453 [Aristolochia fimbriata]|uniref:Uncharacterized protein n=1 Tax=Aristolochia fimbriata TaxID=158543 RepID=A0AAV7FCN9_ARIFI|nr:hypothetical protein H6P81_002453 [Aristolochia fimbriata]
MSAGPTGDDMAVRGVTHRGERRSPNSTQTTSGLARNFLPFRTITLNFHQFTKLPLNSIARKITNFSIGCGWWMTGFRFSKRIYCIIRQRRRKEEEEREERSSCGRGSLKYFFFFFQMAEDINGTVVLGLEEARLWLPAHVLDEPSDPDWQQRRRPPPEKAPPQNYDHSFTKPGWKLRHKPKFPANRARGGPGMQAVFLDSGQKSCGTGFFLPRQAGQINRKTGCSPVLLPCRVVQALNLDVHSLGTPLSPQREVAEKNNNEVELASNKNFDDITPENRFQKGDVFSKSYGASPEIFLPKEWSY